MGLSAATRLINGRSIQCVEFLKPATRSVDGEMTLTETSSKSTKLHFTPLPRTAGRRRWSACGGKKGPLCGGSYYNRNPDGRTKGLLIAILPSGIVRRQIKLDCRRTRTFGMASKSHNAFWRTGRAHRRSHHPSPQSGWPRTPIVSMERTSFCGHACRALRP